MLKIHFHKGNRHEEFFVALDTNDVRTLRAVLDRAEKKEAALRALLQTSGITYLDMREE